MGPTNIAGWTNAAGQYGFKLAAGTYRVREVVPISVRLTTPTAASYTVTLGGGLTVWGKDFANR